MSKTKPFEMRRLEMLSNTIFGVAMTLLAYDLPRGQTFAEMPNLSTLWHGYKAHLIALTFSFIVAGLFWTGHQRRLAHAPNANRLVLIGNLVFLLLIVLLPASTGLYGTAGDSPAVVVIYAGHLAAIALVNTILWWFADQPYRDMPSIVGAGFVFLVTATAFVVSIFERHAAIYFWWMALAGPAVVSYAERRSTRSF